MKNLLSKLKKIKHKYENKYLLKIVKLLYDDNTIECVKYLRKLKFIISMDYVWYCPRQSCNAIILKTDKPYLDFNQKYKCKRCNTIHTSEILILHNKRNLKKYIDEAEKKNN